MSKKLFSINVSRYSNDYSFELFTVSTLEKPKDNAVSFITKTHIDCWQAFERCSCCLIFWPDDCTVPVSLLSKNHVIIPCKNPHLRYCQFFEENSIIYNPSKHFVKNVEGALISENASIGERTTIMPLAYIDEDVIIGDDCYIGCGVKIMGKVMIGNNVVIRENTVIGADGLSTDIDENGKPVHMPQFGGVFIGNNVSIGANTVIARGAIDDTIIDDWASIDNSSFISHNVRIGKRSFVVGETIMFGSSSLGDDSFISGNATIRNGIKIGKRSMIGMGAVVVKDVSDDQTVKGNPAK